MPKSASGPEDRAKVKFRVIEFELEGGNAAVENSVRNLSAALTQRNGGTSPKPPLKAVAPVLAPGSVDLNGDLPEDAVTEIEEQEELSESVPAKARTPRKFPTPEVIDIDLTTGDTPFKQYCELKTPSSDQKKYLVCAAWLKEYRDTPAVTDDHIYTMFKFMKWTVPPDVAGPLRAMKKQGWFTTPERGKYAINHLGENEVNELGASA